MGISVVDTKKYCWIKSLIAVLVMLNYEDLKRGTKNPIQYQKYLSNYGDSLENVISFWENDAYFFLRYLFGHSVALKCMNKIRTLVEECKSKLNQTELISLEKTD